MDIKNQNKLGDLSSRVNVVCYNYSLSFQKRNKIGKK